ncbi:hypothetical protein Tco_0900424 [Tanacetum coccineum]
MITELQVIDSPDGEYLIIHRENNHFRAFDTLWEILHVLDKTRFISLYRVVDDRAQIMSMGILKRIIFYASRVHTLEIEDGTMIHMPAEERRYPLSESYYKGGGGGCWTWNGSEDESETAIYFVTIGSS